MDYSAQSLVMALAPGSSLAQYEIVSSIGAGGMGIVYRARDTRLGRDFALKVMAPHIAADPVMRTRFETEARAVASLSHPSILSIYELAVVDGVRFAVMELLEGSSLRERVAGGPLPWREAARIAAETAEGLAAAHARSIVHRDLKPENIFITRDGHVKILDFGLALQRLDPSGDGEQPTLAQTVQGVVLGTFGYMAPEQITGGRIDGRTDIFALGCLLYEMLTGQQLFGGGTPQEVFARVLHDSAADLSLVDPLAPEQLRAIASRCIERRPERRFDTASAVASALRSLVSGSPPGVFRHAPPRGKSLAVLPFTNAVDPQLDYLADGLTESIINALSQLGTIRVIPRSVVFRYKGQQVDPSSIGAALGVRTILTGRMTAHGDVLTIQAELVDTSSESQLWGEQYRQKTSELMAVQEEIACQISEALRLKLTRSQKNKLRKRSTVNPEAHRAYLRGRHYWNRWTPEGFAQAVECFQEAVDLDPLYAAAYAGLGDTCGTMAYYGHIEPRDGFARARAAATRALDLDRDLAEAHVTVALDALFARWEWAAAERALHRAQRLNPSLSIAHAVNALYLSTTGRFEEAIAAAMTGRDLDPLSLLANMGVSWAYRFAGHAAAAAREALRARELAPAFEEAGNVIIASYEELGRFEEAARLISEQRCWGLRLDGQALAAAYRAGGPEQYWRTRIDLMQAAAAEPPAAIHLGFAIANLHLGRRDRALDHVERLVDAHAGCAVFVAIDPMLRRLRGDERFEGLLRRIGTPLASTPPVTAA